MATYYVATTGNDSNDGSIGSPKKTLTAGIGLMVAGDTLRVRGGTYDDHLRVLVNKIGTALNRYTVEGYPGERPILRPSNGFRCIILGSNSKYITLRNMTFDGSANPTDGSSYLNRIENAATSILLEDIEIHDYFSNGVYINGGTDITLRDCSFHDGVTAGCVPGSRGYGVYAHHGVNVVIEDCEIYNMPGGGIQAYPGPHTGLIIRRNKIYRNNFCTTSQVGGITVMEETSANGGGNITNPQIYNNSISNNDHSGTGQTSGIRIGQGVSGAKVWNNSIYGSKYGINIQTGSAGAPSNTILTNNIIRGSITTAIANAGTGTVQTTNMTTDPHFVSPSGDDLRLLSDSAAIDGGTEVVDFNDDIDGNTRPAGADWDIGAYEFQSTPPDPEDLDTYFVDPVSGSDTNDGDEAHPFLTLAKGLSVLTPSDTLILRGGTHIMSAEYGTTAAHTFGGVSDSWENATTIKNYPGETAVVKGLGFNLDGAIATGGIGYVVFESDVKGNFIVEQASSGATSSSYGFRVNQTTHHVRFTKLVVRNFNSHGIYGGNGASTPSFIEILDSEISNNGTADGKHGITATRSSDWLIQNNYIFGNRDYGISLYNATANQHNRASIKRNRIEGRKSGASGTAFAIRISSGVGHEIHQNVINGLGSAPVAFTGGIQVSDGSNGVEVFNNTVYNVSVGSQVDATAVDTLLRNNAYNVVTTRLVDNGTGTNSLFSLCASGCLVNGLAGFTTPGSDFTLAPGSAALGAGTDVGYGEDIGAYQSPVLLSATVEDAAPSNIILTFTSGSSLLPTTGITGFTVSRNGSNNVITSATLVDRVVTLTVTTPISAGDTVTVSYSGGNLTNSITLGTATYQGFAYNLTNQAVTNNVNDPVTISPITGLVVRRL